jgi:hypothetical protein
LDDQEDGAARLAAERDALVHERNDLMNQRNELMSQRDALLLERNALLTIRNELEVQRNALEAQRNDLEGQRNALMLARDEAMRGRDALMLARDAVMQERDHLVEDRDAVYRDRDLLRCQLSKMRPLLSPALRLLTRGQFHLPPTQLLDLSGTIICCGYWGSGNGIAAAMLEQLLPDPPPAANAMMGILRDTAAMRTTALIEDTTRLAAEYGYNRCGIATFQDSTASLSVYSDNEDGEDHTVDIFGIPIANAFHEHVFKTHEACGPHIKTLVSHGARVVLAVRHPLDILVSMANKSAGGGIDLLRSKALLRQILTQLKNYFLSFDALPADQVFHSRYESVITDFTAAARDITRFVSHARSEALDETRIRPELLDMDLSLPGHRWKPGAGKWRRYLTEDIIGLIEDEGILDLVVHLGYESPDLSLLSDDSERERIVPSEISDTPSLMFLLHGSLNPEDAIDAIRTHAPRTIVGRLDEDMFFLAQHRDSADRFAAMANDPRFRSLLKWQ